MAQNKGPVIVTLTCEANPSTDTQEIDRAEWAAITPGERLALIQDLADTHVANAGGYGWYIDDSDDEAAVGDSVPDPLRGLAEWLVWLDTEAAELAKLPTMVEIIDRARKALGKED